MKLNNTEKRFQTSQVKWAKDMNNLQSQLNQAYQEIERLRNNTSELAYSDIKNPPIPDNKNFFEELLPNIGGLQQSPNTDPFQHKRNHTLQDPMLIQDRQNSTAYNSSDLLRDQMI